MKTKPSLNRTQRNIFHNMEVRSVVYTISIVFHLSFFLWHLIGFCSWGVGGEYCPDYAWGYDCLGPYGDWGIWQIYEDKLYFFYLDSAMNYFMQDPKHYSHVGDKRWSMWFNTTTVFNTNCFLMDGSTDNELLYTFYD
jgi:hypothetical protein